MKRNNSRGVTLVELLLVLVLILSLGGLATVNFMEFLRQRDPKLFVKDIGAYVRYLQFKSIEEGRVQKLSAGEERGTLQTFAQSEDKKFIPIKDSLSNRFQNQGRYRMEIENGSEIYFFPDGTVTRSEIRIFKGDHKIARLAVSNRLGSLKVEFYV